MKDSISAYMQVFENKRASFEAVNSFRAHYKNAPIRIVSDGGDDFSEICEMFHAEFVYSDIRTTTQRMTLNGVNEYLRRIYDYCLAVDTNWVLLLEDDVRTIRPIRAFPGGYSAV